MDTVSAQNCEEEASVSSQLTMKTTMAPTQPESQTSESAEENLVHQLLEETDTAMSHVEEEAPATLKSLEDEEILTDDGNGSSKPPAMDIETEARERVDVPTTAELSLRLEQTSPEDTSVGEASSSRATEKPAHQPMDVDNHDTSLSSYKHPEPAGGLVPLTTAGPSTSTLLNNYPPTVYPPIEQNNDKGGDDAFPHVENTTSLSMNTRSTGTNSPAPTTEAEDMDDEYDASSDENDYESSEVSQGEDFQEDLKDALADRNFSFAGSFYHAGLLFSSPNPCLHISGIGIIGLPLSDRDAKAIVSCATLAPFGRGERTVVDKDVRHTWEIEPTRISFANPHWDKYVKDVVCVEVCKSLGVSLGNAQSQMELYKLLLYEKGSHFLPHQDTQKANGMFATVIIVLPSAYTGGQVILSHSSTRKTIDFAKDSMLSTALLAWYTDVKHEVKEITSGYRLALSYNLIHVASPGVPSPTLPDMSNSLASLRRVLKKWRDDKYDEASGQRIVAYLLGHEYSPVNLKDGIKALKGNDAHRVTFIRSVAEELGFMVGIANLKHHVTGPADDCGGGYHRRNRYKYYDSDGDEDEDEETPDMAEVDSRSTSIEGLVDLNGCPLLPVGSVDLDDECLIPKDAFEDESPDDTEYEGYMGNWAGQVEHWYRRTALVLMRESDVDDICFEAGGISYAYERLKRSSTIPPTSEDRLWATRLLQRRPSLNKTHVLTLMDYTFKWQDLTLWKDVMKCSSCTLKDVDNTLFLKAWQLFSFESVCLSYEELLARSTDLRERINFIYSLPPQTTDDNRQIVRAWCQKESDKILSSYNSINVQDITIIMSIIRAAGLESFSRTMMPNLLKKAGSYTFLLALRKALIDGRQSILERQAQPHFTSSLPSGTLPATDAAIDAATTSRVEVNPSLNPTAALLDKLIKVCLTTAALQWSDSGQIQTHTHGYPYYGYRHTTQTTPTQANRVDRIIEIIEQAIASSDMDIIKILFVNVLKAPGDTAMKFTQIYTPLIPRLKASLAKAKHDLCIPPFIDLLQIFIGSYLRDILGKKGQMLNANLRRIGCGCPDCQPLDKFIMDPTTSTTTFRLVQKRRIHLEQRIASAADLCTYATIRTGSPHGVQVTKRPEIVAASMWGHRQQDARNFLASIGADSVIQRIMGSRYPDVTLALQGTHPFGTVRAAIEVPATSSRTQTIPTINAGPSTSHEATNAVQPVALSSSTTTVPPPAPSVPHRLAGTKRKSAPRPVIQLGPVIDLTGDDSS